MQNAWAQLSRAQLWAPKKRTVGPRTVGPRGPTVRPEKVANWAPDSWAPKIYHRKNKYIIKKQNTASKIQTEMLPKINYVSYKNKYTFKKTRYFP